MSAVEVMSDGGQIYASALAVRPEDAEALHARWTARDKDSRDAPHRSQQPEKRTTFAFRLCNWT